MSPPFESLRGREAVESVEPKSNSAFGPSSGQGEISVERGYTRVTAIIDWTDLWVEARHRR